MATNNRRGTDRAAAGQSLRRAGERGQQTARKADLSTFETNYRKTGQISFSKDTSKSARNAIRAGMAAGMSARAAQKKGNAAAASYYTGKNDRRAQPAQVERRGGRDRRDRRQA